MAARAPGTPCAPAAAEGLGLAAEGGSLPTCRDREDAQDDARHDCEDARDGWRLAERIENAAEAAENCGSGVGSVPGKQSPSHGDGCGGTALLPTCRHAHPASAIGASASLEDASPKQRQGAPSRARLGATAAPHPARRVAARTPRALADCPGEHLAPLCAEDRAVRSRSPRHRFHTVTARIPSRGRSRPAALVLFMIMCSNHIYPCRHALSAHTFASLHGTFEFETFLRVALYK